MKTQFEPHAPNTNTTVNKEAAAEKKCDLFVHTTTLNGGRLLYFTINNTSWACFHFHRNAESFVQWATE